MDLQILEKESLLTKEDYATKSQRH